MVTQQEYWSSLTTTMTDKVIGDEYLLLEELGRGSYGCLFLGQSLKNHNYVAVKILCKAGLDHQQRKTQQLEADIQSALHHPNILALHNVLQDDEYIYMVMEVCDQGDMFDFVIRDLQANPIRDDQWVKTAFLQILDAVEYMHAQHVYHRDIKLENILLQADDDDEDRVICKVADFGLATRERYSTEFGCGSTNYLAPEHFDDEPSEVMRSNDEAVLPYDAAASDTWSLGILLLALIFGRNPWQEASTHDPAFAEFKRRSAMLKQTLFPELSAACHHFLTSVLAVHPADRPTVKEMKSQFMALDRLTVSDEEENAVFIEEEPVRIPCPTSNAGNAGNAGIVGKTTKMAFPSYDSAIFSVPPGTSWSELVEQDLEQQNHSDKDSVTHSSASHASLVDDDDGTDMFVHSQEKESWWL